jgi:hypothetical protein
MSGFKLEGMSQDPLPPSPKVRAGQTPTRLTKEEYLKRWRQRFYDPAFLSKNDDLDAIAEIAWDAYADERKSPRTDQTCPSEMSKTFRLARTAREIIDAVPRFEVDFVDLSVMTAEYGV